MARAQRRRGSRGRRGGREQRRQEGAPTPATATDAGGAVPTARAPTAVAAPRAPRERRGWRPFGFLRRLQPRAVADVVSELRKVTWPTFAETRYLTIVVAVVAVAVGVVLGLFDLLFGWIVEQLFF